MEQEQLTKQQVSMIRQAAGLGGIIFNWDIDYQVGAGIIGSQEKCLWSKDGRRISCTLVPGGGYIISQGREPDPLYSELERKYNNGH
jgi:hypothetical protein